MTSSTNPATSPSSASRQTIYVCPMHPQVRQLQPGTCPICGGMKLEPQQVAQDAVVPEHYTAPTAAHSTPQPASTSTNYSALITIVLFILLVSSLGSLKAISAGTFAWMDLSRYVMAGFFLIFGLFKLIDVKGFAEGFATYDLLAKRLSWYGYIYPFIELGLGLAFLINLAPLTTNLITFLVMAISSLGVIKALSGHQPIVCACLGTALNLPLSKVTLIEDVVMGTMALAHIAIIILTANSHHWGHVATAHPPALFAMTTIAILALGGIIATQLHRSSAAS